MTNSKANSRPKTLIAGCGDIGCRLASRLIEAGHEVWGIRRNGAKLPGPIRPITADLGDRQRFPELPPDLDYLVYCAAADQRSESAYRHGYITGLRNTLDQLTVQGQTPRRVFFTSSTAVYHQNRGEWVDETSSTRPTAFAGRILLEAETLLRNSGLPHTVVRFAGIYGPGREHLLTQVKNGELRVSDDYPQYTNRIHSDDCAGLLQHLIQLPQPEPCYLGVDHHPASQAEVVDWLADQLGMAKPARTGPASAAQQNKRCQNTNLLAAGYVFQYPTYREGYRSLLTQ